MTNTIKSVIALGMKDQFHIPKPFGDQHRLTEGVTPLFITPGYRGVDHDNKIQFPHGLLLRLDRVGKVEDILAQYVPA